MEIESKLEKEYNLILDKMGEISDVSSEAYQKLLNRLTVIQDLLSKESARLNTEQELRTKVESINIEKDKLEIAQANLDLENRKLDIEVTENRKKAKQTVWGHVWDIGKKIIGGLVIFAVDVGVIGISIAANEKGVTLPKVGEKFLEKVSTSDK